MRKFRITIGDRVFEVLAEEIVMEQRSTPAQGGGAPVGAGPASVAPLPPSPNAPTVAVAAGAGAVVSPLSGKIVTVDAVVGQEVQEGTQLVTVEAMKMNTFVYAPGTGRVSQVHVAVGDAVQEGQVLVTLEPL